jgi:hypothetical protein
MVSRGPGHIQRTIAQVVSELEAPHHGYWRLDQLGPYVYRGAWADTPAQRRALQRATRQMWLDQDRWPEIAFLVQADGRAHHVLLRPS